MRKFEKKINELGLEKGKLSKSLNDFVFNFDLAQDELKVLKMNLKEAQSKEDNDDEIDSLLSKIDEMENDLESADNELVKKVEMHHKYGDLYAARAQKMREAREAKAAAKHNKPLENAQVNIENTTLKNNIDNNQAPKVQEVSSNSQTSNTEKVESTPSAKVEEKKEKETNWLLWGVLGVAGIFVGINLFKNKR